MYLKFRIRGCALAYVTFHTVRSATAHHRLYHQKITYRCPECDKTIPTPNSLWLHLYCHKRKQFKCTTCDETFVYKSKLKQHRRRHRSQKLYECFHGSCNKKYKHPQDLTRHIAKHLNKQYECDFCNKTFLEKRLLKWHTAVHLKTAAYTCSKCGMGFKHNNQYYRHRKYCNV